MLAWVFGNLGEGKRRKPAGAKRPPYEESKVIAAGRDVEARRALASFEDLEPEFLYYFATDPAPEVRREVAENRGTPLQADVLLARDVDDEVRLELACKIGRLVPTLTPEENERLTALALEVLEILAQDHVPRVRATIAEELKRATNVPAHIVKRLARDVEEMVSAPILEYSPLLSDRDLLEIIAGGSAGRALVALARRRDLGEAVADAVHGTEDVDAVAALLENRTARISAKTLDMIAVDAAGHKEWHAPMVGRDNLPVRVIRRIASFVSAALLENLIERHDLAPAVVTDLRKAVRRRIEAGELAGEKPKVDEAEKRAQEMFGAGTLNEEAVLDAIDGNDHGFVRHALVLMSGLPAQAVRRLMDTGTAKGLTALAWKAGLTMGMAETLQRRFGRVKPGQLVRAAKDGKYPIADADLEWHLDFYL